MFLSEFLKVRLHTTTVLVVVVYFGSIFEG